jgi:hypothetical protein
MRDDVLQSAEASGEFFRSYLAIDMSLDENILSRPEYDLVMAGKRHWRDRSVGPRPPAQQPR